MWLGQYAFEFTVFLPMQLLALLAGLFPGDVLLVPDLDLLALEVAAMQLQGHQVLALSIFVQVFEEVAQFYELPVFLGSSEGVDPVEVLGVERGSYGVGVHEDDLLHVPAQVLQGLDEVHLVDDNAVLPAEVASDALLGVQLLHYLLDVGVLQGGENDHLVQLRHLEYKRIQPESLGHVKWQDRVLDFHLHTEVIPLWLLECEVHECLLQVHHQGAPVLILHLRQQAHSVLLPAQPSQHLGNL